MILFQNNLNTLYECGEGVGGVVEHYYELDVPVFFFGIFGSLREASQFEKVTLSATLLKIVFN